MLEACYLEFDSPSHCRQLCLEKAPRNIFTDLISYVRYLLAWRKVFGAQGANKELSLARRGLDPGYRSLICE